ncbi:hypothetical protein RCZ04_00480 [Capnocytophaga sp. HP1101]
MKQEDIIVKQIYNVVFEQALKRYIDLLKEGRVREPYKEPHWQKGQALYNQLNEEGREHFKSFLSMVMSETIADILGYLDGIASFEGQPEPFELFCNGEKVSGDLQELFLMDLEAKGI